MKIGIFVAVAKNSGGIYQYTASMLRALRDWNTDHEFVIVKFKGNQLPLDDFSGPRWSIATTDPQMAQGKNVTRFLSGDGLDLMRPNINPEMEKFFKEQRIELMISPAPVSLFFEWGVPYIMAIHDLQHRLQPEFPEVSAGNIWKSREYVFRNGVRYAEAILVDSEVGKEDVLNFYGDYISPDRVYPLPFLPSYRPDDIEITEAGQRQIQKKYNLPDKFLFYPAQFWLHKNHSRLIHAVHILRYVHKVDTPLVFVGSNSGGQEAREFVFNNAMLLAEQLGVKDLVCYLGYVPDGDIPFLYSMAKALTMPTFFGPTNIPFLEAWAFGCPVITSNIRGIREQVETAGLLVDPKNTHEMAEGILKLWKDDNIRNPLIEAGYQKNESYTPKDFARNLYQAVNNTIEKLYKKKDAHFCGSIDVKNDNESFGQLAGGQVQLKGYSAAQVTNDQAGNENRNEPADLDQLAKNQFAKGDIQGALKIYLLALEQNPEHALFLNNLGVLYGKIGNKPKAREHYEKAVQLEPQNLTFQKNLADFYCFELDRVEKALKIYHEVLTNHPGDLETLLVMGHICLKHNKVADAVDFYNKALEVDPGNAKAIEALRLIRKTLAQSFLDRSRQDLFEPFQREYGNIHRKIIASHLKDFSLSDDERVFLDELSGRQRSVVKSSEAISLLLASMLYYYPHQLPIEIDILQVPDWLQEDYGAFLLSYPRCFTKKGEVENYSLYIKRLFASFHKTIKAAPDSDAVQKMAGVFTQKAYFIPLYFSRGNLKDIYLHRAAIAESSLEAQGCELEFSFPPRTAKRKKIRLGIYARVIAPGTEAFATLPVYEYLTRQEFEVFIYVHQRNGNPVETHARQSADRFIELPDNMKSSVDLIRADDLDVLFFSNNLSAVMNQAFILANHRLARFQCVHFCQPVTSGLKHIDYFILGDLIQEDGKTDEQFCEQIVNLAGSGICFDMRSTDAPRGAVIRREQIGIPGGCGVFASGANFFKIIPELRHLWARLLAKNPDTMLVLFPFGPAWAISYPQSVFRDQFARTLDKYDVKLDRLIILDPLPQREDIKELLRLADVYLDAVPYSGATSLLDPLEVGVPPVVMEGDDLRSRQGPAILKEIGLGELVVKGEEEYIALAGRLAVDAVFRTELREKILNRMQDTPAFLDPKGYAQKISTALKNIVSTESAFM